MLDFQSITVGVLEHVFGQTHAGLRHDFSVWNHLCYHFLYLLLVVNS